MEIQIYNDVDDESRSASVLRTARYDICIYTKRYFDRSYNFNYGCCRDDVWRFTAIRNSALRTRSTKHETRGVAQYFPSRAFFRWVALAELYELFKAPRRLVHHDTWVDVVVVTGNAKFRHRHNLYRYNNLYNLYYLCIQIRRLERPLSQFSSWSVKLDVLKTIRPRCIYRSS